MPKYILHYFPINGRAVIPRALLSYVKADWENDVIKMEDWPKTKKSGLWEYEQLPVLEVDGKKYSQSHAINIYLGQTFNLMGKDKEEDYQINNILIAFEDYTLPIWDAMYNQDPAKKAELKPKAEEKFKFYVKIFEKKYTELGKGKYYLGERFTLADIALTTTLLDDIDTLGLKEEILKELAPNLYELIKRVKENELKELFEKIFVKFG